MTDDPSVNDRILDAALRLAASRRWSAITLRDIAGEAGLSLAALNEAVPSRAAILALLNRRIDQRMLAALDKDPVSGDDHDRIFEVLMRRLEVMAPYREAVASIIADPTTLLDDPPEIGVKRSSAQLTRYYTPQSLIGRQVAGVVNFPPRQIGKFMSEVLVLGFPDADGEVVLVAVERPVPDGGRLF